MVMFSGGYEQRVKIDNFFEAQKSGLVDGLPCT